MSVVDASVWVSLMAEDDVNHAATLKWFERQIAEGATLAAPSLVLVEVAAAMTRRTGDGAVGDRAVRRLQHMPELVLVDLTVDRAIRAASAAGLLVLRGADAVYAALAIELGVPLITWDRQQGERSARLVTVSSPTDDMMDDQ